MKKTLAVLLCTLFTAGLVLASSGSSSTTATGKNHKMTGVVVSVDAAAKTITVKDDKGESHTAPVLGKAVDSLKTLKPGEKVTLVCHDNDKGEHEGITHIKVAGTTSSSAK